MVDGMSKEQEHLQFDTRNRSCIKLSTGFILQMQRSGKTEKFLAEFADSGTIKKKKNARNYDNR